MKKTPGRIITNPLFNRSKISEKDLHTLDLRGWIPGPSEKIEKYLDRAVALDDFFSYPPEEVDHFLTDGDWKEGIERCKSLFGFSPDWIVAHYSNKNLSFFQGGATWIIERGGINIPLIQLKERFESGRFLGLYPRDEVLAHEAVHAARMAFDEPHFEEILSYKTSRRWWRRFFGPLFERPWETYLFVALLFVPLALEVGEIFWPLEKYRVLKFLPLAFFALLTFRLVFLQFVFASAIKRLRPLLGETVKPLAVALRLTDREITLFGIGSNRKLKKLLLEGDSLRWRLLKKNYFT